MSRRVLAASAAALALSAGLVAPAATASAASSWSSAPTAQVTTADAAAVARREAYEARLLALVNRARAKGGLAPLARSGCASSFAVLQATRMATHEWMYHQYLGPIVDRCHGLSVGENVGNGTVSADQLFLLWMYSAPHRRNILNPAYTHMGNGARTDAGRVYSSQVFLRLR